MLITIVWTNITDWPPILQSIFLRRTANQRAKTPASFEDLQQFALEVLKTVRSRDTVPQAVDQKGTRLPGEIRGYWPASRPVH